MCICHLTCYVVRDWPIILERRVQQRLCAKIVIIDARGRMKMVQ